MRYRFITAILLILIACAAQFMLAGIGVSIDLVLGSLIAFAFFFELPELCIFVLWGVFVMAWPGFGAEIAVFAALPLLAFAFRKAFAWAPWAGIPVMIICGFAAFYGMFAPGLFVRDTAAVVLDVVGSLIYAEIVLASLNRAEK